MFNHKVFVFAFDEYSAFAIFQSSVHRFWSLSQSSRLGAAVNYSVSKAFDTFPFPNDWKNIGALDAVGKTYHEFRASIMARSDDGLTTIYNRFNDPAELDPDIVRLRELHVAMDRAVLDAYGWSDVSASCDFFLDFEIDEEQWGNKKKPYRYRWSDEVRDEVLARLLELNAKRAEEEVRTGASISMKVSKETGIKRASKRAGMQDLFS